MSKILKVKKVNALKIAFIFAVIYGLLSLVIFTIAGIFGLAVQGEPIGLMLAFLMPILYAIAGFIGGLIMGAMYNLVSRWIGGVEVEVEEIEKFSE
jgi:hypothetical protein